MSKRGLKEAKLDFRVLEKLPDRRLTPNGNPLRLRSGPLLSGAAGVKSAGAFDAAAAIDGHVLEASRLLQSESRERQT
jgi:hypothetical protein